MLSMAYCDRDVSMLHGKSADASEVFLLIRIAGVQECTLVSCTLSSWKSSCCIQALRRCCMQIWHIPA